MPADFELPDLMNIYDDVPDVVATDVPCRCVPIFNPKTFFVCNAGSPMTRYGPTHWVDLDTDNGYIPDGFTRDQAFKIESDDVFWELVVFTPLGRIHLSVDYVELRYTNTEREYMRCYCTRIYFEVV